MWLYSYRGDNPETELVEVATYARNIANRLRVRYSALETYLTGIIMMNNAFPEASQYDTKTLVPLTLLIVILLLELFLRGPLQQQLSRDSLF